MPSKTDFLLGSASAVVLSIALSQVAFAQATGAPGAPVQRQERPDTRPAGAQASENYDPKGVPMGSFRLFPELELDEVYNDNIYATTFGAAGRTASFIQLIKPTVKLNSDW